MGRAVRIAVVTRVGPCEDGSNLAVAMDLWQEDGPPSLQDPLGTWRPVSAMVMLSLRTRVFVPGEILVLDDGGREIGGRGRAPGKWDVTLEHFDTLEAAAVRAAEVLDL